MSLKTLFNRLQKITTQRNELIAQLNTEIEKKYGFHYSDVDADEIIDAVDYGQRPMSFEEFHARMTKLRDIAIEYGLIETEDEDD